MSDLGPKSDSLWQAVIADMHAREEMGLRKYGRFLTAKSREMGLQEAYEEALDLCVYLKKALVEMEGKHDSQEARGILPHDTGR
jgi:hypothetical protein